MDNDKEAIHRESRRIITDRYYERHRQEVGERRKTKYDANKDTEEWKARRQKANKTYADKRKERLIQEKALLIKLQEQETALLTKIEEQETARKERLKYERALLTELKEQNQAMLLKVQER